MILSEIVKACRGSFGYPADMEITEISSDTRTLKKGSVFIALEGEKFDGHDYAIEAIEKGAEAVICQRPIPDVKCIIVDSTKQALLELAEFYRRRFPAMLIGLTGSVGKTTVTEMLAEIMRCSGEVLKTEENRHNEIGLPLTIFKFNENHKTAVVEMGITATNGISNLSVVAQPDVAIITNIGYAHYESYGSLDSILKAKLEILDGASYNTPLILNLDDKLLAQVEARGARKIVYYSLKDKKADFYAEGIKFKDGKTTFKVNFEGQKVALSINCLGKHNVRNALSAFAGAISAGASIEDIKTGLERYQPTGYRQQIYNTKSCKVITDLSNFSPDAIKAAIQILYQIDAEEGGRKIAVLADMPSLGKMSRNLHKSVGETLERSGVDMLFCIDEKADGYIAAAVKKGFDEDNARLFTSTEELGRCLRETVRPNDIVLLKCRKEYKPLEILKMLDEDV